MLKKIIITAVLILISLQFIPIDKTNPSIDKTITLNTDAKVMQILKKSCYDCHSNETKWSIYSDIAPLSFGVISHVTDGRKALNFSNYKNIDAEIKIARLQRAIKTVKNNMMPLGSYLLFHEKSHLTEPEKDILITWFEKELQMLYK